MIIFKHFDVTNPRATEFSEMMQKQPLCRSRTFNVTNSGTNQKPMRDFLSQRYRRQAIPIAQGKIQPSITLYSFDHHHQT